MGIFKTVRDTILVKWEKSCINMALIKCHLEHVEFFSKKNYFQKSQLFPGYHRAKNYGDVDFFKMTLFYE